MIQVGLSIVSLESMTLFVDNPILDELLPKHKSKVLDALSTEIAMK